MTDAAFAALLVSSACAVATRLLYHISFRLSRGFWKVFQIFLKFFSFLVIRKECRLSALFGRPCYYTTMFSFCQGVFQKFLKNFFASLFRSPHRSESPSPMRSLKALPNSQTLGIFHCDFCRFFGSSSIIPHPSPFVNTFLQSFLSFFEIFCVFSSKKHPSDRGVLEMLHFKQ